MALVFKFCPLCTTALAPRDVLGKTRNACPSCTFVHWNNPVPVAVVIVPTSVGFLLVRRAIEPRKGQVALPGGFVDEMELPADGAKREVFEEAGLVIEIERLLDMQLTKGNEILMFYLAKPTDATPVAGPESSEVVVVAHGAPLPADLAFPLHKQAIEDWIAGKK